MGGGLHNIWTAEGWLYASAVLDLCLRRIVGWSMQEGMTSQLVAMAVWRRGKPVSLLNHSDQGSQYTSEHFQALLKEQGIICSMSRAVSLGQLGEGEFLQLTEDGAHSPKGVPHQGAGPLSCL